MGRIAMKFDVGDAMLQRGDALVAFRDGGGLFSWASSRAASRSARVSSNCFFNLVSSRSAHINDFCKSRIFIVMFSPRATANSAFSWESRSWLMKSILCVRRSSAMPYK